MPKAFTPSEKELITRRLLEQGFRLFSAHGLDKTNVEEIALAAGISKGAFYRFYESREALFMDVIEQAETRVRQQLLAIIDRPGPTPRARLLAIFKQALDLFRSMPILQFFSGSDFDLLFRRVPEEKVRNHLINDRAFIDKLVASCQKAGIPIQIEPEQVVSVLYPLVLAILHEDSLGPVIGNDQMDVLLELVAAYCLGEVQIHATASPGADMRKEDLP